MSRGIWKGPFVHPSLLKKVDKQKEQSKKSPIKTWSRNSTIIPEFVGHNFLIRVAKSKMKQLIETSNSILSCKLGLSLSLSM